MRVWGMGFVLAALAAAPAMAADMPARMPTKAPMAAPEAFYSWTGFYVGANVGGSWGKQDNSLVSAAGVVVQSNSAKLNGAVGGGQIGYNWQLNQIVFGLEGDFDWSGQKGDGDPLYTSPANPLIAGGGGFSIPYRDRLEWFGTIRGRLGYAMGRWLPYVTGGWAFGHGKIDGTATIAGVNTAFSGSTDYSGWTAGGGIEWAFDNRWSAKLEYLHIDFGKGSNVAITPAANIVSGKMTDDIVRAGLNYKFF
jgi:outer membrane immunogenic protein